MKARLVVVIVLVETGIETHIDDGIRRRIVNALHSQTLEQNGFGFLKDLFATRTGIDIVGNLHRSRLGASDGGIGGIGKEILG